MTVISRGLLCGAAGVLLAALFTVTAAAQAPTTPAATPAAAPQQKLYKPEELDQMLAPIALYNDQLLSQVLMAATYPLEVVEAGRWSKANPNLKGDAAVKAVQDKTWDVSVKSLVAFPQILVNMSEQIEWTQKLGDAMLSQQQDVAASIQRFGKLSYDAGNLKTSDQQKVNVQPAAAGAPQTIVIEPASPQTVYVPVYQPSWAYGTWPYAAYPPYYYPPPPGYGYGAPLLRGFMFGAGVAAAGSLFGGWDWGRGDVNVNRAVNTEGDAKATLEVGGDGWTFPIPLVKRGDGWRFDIVAGAEEIQDREIGRNELAVVQVLLAIVDAQHDYIDADPMKVGTPQYARRLLSSPGKKDGLYWEQRPGDPESPLGNLVAHAQADGANKEEGYHGYHYRMLYAQGANAPGGAHDYLVKNKMIGGFAVIAWPVRYADTGVMTFMVSHDGVVYEKDLGPNTAAAAARIKSFDPDKTWKKADTTP